MTTRPAFPAAERNVLLAVKGVGPTVIARLEQMGIASLDELARRDAGAICAEAAAILGSTCWKNSPQARRAIEAAIAAAEHVVRAGAAEAGTTAGTPAASPPEGAAVPKRKPSRSRARARITTSEPRAR